jgi:MFS superfamily sulfate permease-like transporter
MKPALSVPREGFKGLKENYSGDAVSGLIVFLLALPLSLGIAKASEFPPLMGLLTAIIGGVFVSFFAGSSLTIKGPAAGLIVIMVEGVSEFGGGETGWRLLLGAIVVAGLVQVLFGLLKMGRLVDFFPLSAVHGMLAAIGIIIILKQVPILLNVNPAMARGKDPFELLGLIPSFFRHLDLRASMVGLVSVAIMMGWGKISLVGLKKIPAALVVLFFAIPAELLLDFQHTEPPYALVDIGNLADSIGVNVDFAGIWQTGIFVKYVVMLALVASLESLLTVKAVDMMDPHHRKSDANKDLIAEGMGNVLAGIMGGLPMISEVARSSANVANGAKTRWANFFHGFFILVFVVFASPLLELIPNTALAAMLITVGIKLAHPRQFVQIFRIGKAQLAIFLVTIFFTLYIDLLVGIAAGVVLNLFIHLFNGLPFLNLFRVPVTVSFNDNQYLVQVEKSAVFSNYLGLKAKLEAIPKNMTVTLDFSAAEVVDHSVMENVRYFEQVYKNTGGNFSIIGLDRCRPL